jgi:hypothetical protein
MRPVANVAGYNRSISGACVYLRKEAYEKLGPLDETYWLGFEDVDYGLTAWTRGIRCYYQPAATLIHHESASRGYSQGKRELGSMRHFWGKWHKAFLHRTLPTSESVDFVLSRASDALWHDYVDDQASRLRDLGYEVAVHAVAEGTPAHAADETVVSSLRDRSSLKVCCDWGAATTVWLSSLEHGKPVYLLPTVESGAFPGDTNRQSAIVAGYRPEFDYIAPNRWTADQLRAEAAWETAARVVPALSPVVSAIPVADATRPNTDGRPATVPRVVSVGLAAAQRADLDQIVHAHGGETTHVGEDLDRAQLETIAGLGPRAIVTSAEWPNSLAPLALMSTGGVLVGRANEKTRYEVLDGYNALLIDPSDTSRLGQTLADLLSDEQMWSELRGNGLASAQKAYAACTPALVAALGSIAVTPV